jgi:HAD superfamily hydrolase (TIGR01450 family)
MTHLVQQFDTVFFDLDGVIYVGPHAVPHAVTVVGELHLAGIRCAYVTNNAFRTASETAAHLTDLGFSCSGTDVITSPQAAVPLLTNFVAPGSRVLVVGGNGISQTLRDAGYIPVSSLDDQPVAVMQGYSPDLTWRDLAEACYAVAGGLPWIATNPDLTFPTPRGIAPGNGSMVQVVATAPGRSPDAIAGKPEPPLLHEALKRTEATTPLMVGDRLDTDIAAGKRVGMATLLVLTGVTTIRELLTAGEHERPDFVGRDLRVLVRPYPQVQISDGEATCGRARAWAREGALIVEGGVFEDALRAASVVAWRTPGMDLALALETLSALAGSVSDDNREDHHAQ